MNPDLSRRVAKVIDVMVALGLSIDDRFDFAKRVDSASDFGSLPEPDRRAIQAAERIQASGVPIADIISFKVKDNEAGS